VVTALDRTQAELAGIVGATRVLADEKTCAAFAVDGKRPRLVVYPAGAEQVAEVLRYASQERLAVIPSCNGTKLTTGNPPREYDLALSLKEMNRVRHYEPADLTVSAEPGMKFGDFRHSVGRDELWLPLNPPGGNSASLGGIVATNAAGSYRCCYGTPRDMVLGMKIATTEGKVIKSGGRVVKNVAGYDITKLMIGSFGTLGVIVEISFKLFPRPVERATFVLSATAPEKAREVRRALQQSPIRPLRVALLDSSCLELLRIEGLPDISGDGRLIWIEVTGSKRVLDRCCAELNEISARTGEKMLPQMTEDAVESVWQWIDDPHAIGRENAEDWLLKIALPVSAVEEYMIRAKHDLRQPRHRERVWAEPLGGIVHVWLHPQTDAGGSDETTLKLRRLAEELGGSLVVEIAPAAGKAKVDAWGAVGDDFEVMRKLKGAWDPNHVLSPGRFVGGL
jgi:glycolate oxidase FAD binding subunit